MMTRRVLSKLPLAFQSLLLRAFVALPMMLACVLVLSSIAFAGSTPDQPTLVLLGDVPPAPAPTISLAPDAGPTVNGGNFAENLAKVLANPDDLNAVAKLVEDAVMSGQWGLLVSLLLTVLLFQLRKRLPETSKVGAWFRSKVGVMVSNLGLALGGGFITAFASGQPLSVALVFKAISIALGSAGIWSTVKAISEARAESAAKDAGAAAAAAPGSTLDK